MIELVGGVGLEKGEEVNGWTHNRLNMALTVMFPHCRQDGVVIEGK